MFTVTGTIDSVAYRVGVHDEPVEGGLHGCVMGSDNATSLLTLHEGEQTRQTPTHDAYTLSLTDPESIYAFLHEHTEVGLVEGDAPVNENDPGTIY